VRVLRIYLSCCLLLTACTAGGGMDAGAGMDAQPFDEAGFVDRPVPDAPLDPFDSSMACGRAVIESTRLPGSLLFVFDRSGSMNAAPAGGSGPPTRWSIAGGAIMAALDASPDETNVGMLLFPPEGSMCNVVLGADVPQVPIGPLSTTRAQVARELERVPDGPATSIFEALRSGWEHLADLGARGERAVVLVTDGRENCAPERRTRAFEQAASELEMNGHRTFVVGLTQSNSDLSTLAFNGGTPRNETCLAECTTPACEVDVDVPCPDTGAACATFPDGEPGGSRTAGFCGCLTSADCPAPMTCELVEGESVCVGSPNCCHYDAVAGSFDADFRAALAAIAEEVVDTCVFDLPRGDEPGLFDPTQVNVRVTIGTEDPSTIGRSSDPAVSSWEYTDDEQTSIVIQGPLCDDLRSGTATVEIVLGCPTVLI